MRGAPTTKLGRLSVVVSGAQILHHHAPGPSFVRLMLCTSHLQGVQSTLPPPSNASGWSKKARIWALELKASNSAIDLDSPDRNKSDLPSTAVPNPDDVLNDYMDVVSEDEADVLGNGFDLREHDNCALLSYRVVLSSLSRPVQCPATLFKRIPLGTSR